MCSSLPNRVNITVSPDNVGLKLPKVMKREKRQDDLLSTCIGSILQTSKQITV